MLDLAASFSVDRLRSALVEGERLRIVSRGDLVDVIERGRGWEGVGRLARALDEFDPAEVWTRSDLEIALKRLCRVSGLPEPGVDVPVGRYVVDFFWPDSRLIVEADGFESHGTKSAFRGDRRRDVDLAIAGYRVARFTHEDVLFESRETARRLKELLAVKV